VVITAVFDASAVLAMLRREPGGDRIRPVLRSSAMSTVNFGEVVGFYARRGVAEAAIRRLLDRLPTARFAFDEEAAYTVGLLLPPTQAAGLSFGDRACLALARRLGVRAFTTDRAWLRIADAVGVDIELIR
jgi:PIN domain nuclease of toxin-antitoxin system